MGGLLHCVNGTARALVGPDDVGVGETLEPVPGLWVERTAQGALCGVGARVRLAVGGALAAACAQAAEGSVPRDEATRARLARDGVLVARPRTDRPRAQWARWAEVGVTPRQAERALGATPCLLGEGCLQGPLAPGVPWWDAFLRALEGYGFALGDAGRPPAGAHGRLVRGEPWGATDARAFIATAFRPDGLVVAARSAVRAAHSGACLRCVGAQASRSARGAFAGAVSRGHALLEEDAPPAARAAGFAAQTLARPALGARVRWWPAFDATAPWTQEVASLSGCTCLRAAGSADDCLESIAAHLGPWAGLCESLDERVGAGLCDHAFAFVWTTAQSARSRTMRLMGTRSGGRSRAAGKGSARGAARDGALAETVERRAVIWREGVEHVVSSAADLDRAGRRYLSPRALNAFSERQLAGRDAFNARNYLFAKIPVPFDARARERPLRWYRGVDLASPGRDAVLLPVSWTHMGAPPETDRAHTGERGDAHYCAADTNGLAAGPNPDRAFVRAVSELIERDAIGMWWMTRACRPALPLGDAPDPFVRRAPERFASIGRLLAVLDLTTHPHWPTACAVSWWEEPLLGHYHDVVVTGGCAVSMVLAARRAISENVQVGPVERQETTSWYAPFETGEVRAMARLDPGCEPWLSGQGVAHTPWTGQALRGRGDRQLAERALEALLGFGAGCVVAEHPSGCPPLVVRRVAAPGLCHFWHRLGAPRLARAPVELGWLAQPVPESEMNPVPLLL